MSVWNVFKMELFKNMHDRVNLLIMLGFMAVNTIGGIAVSNQTWNYTMMMLFGFSVAGSAVFLFIYPYQMARTDYKNKVMSLLIASGVSRVQYYFVKIGATLLFSFLSLIMLVVLPLVIILVSHDMYLALEILDFTFEVDAASLGIVFFGWLSYFFILMTSVIISRGRAYTIFVFLGLSIAVSQIALMFYRTFGGPWWQISTTMILVQHFITMAVMGLIGILVLRKQNL